MIKQKFLNLVLSLLVVASLLFGGINKVSAQEPAPTVPQGSGQAQDPTLPADPTFTNRVTPAERQAVADSNTSRGLLPGVANPLPVVKNNVLLRPIHLWCRIILAHSPIMPTARSPRVPLPALHWMPVVQAILPLPL